MKERQEIEFKYSNDYDKRIKEILATQKD